MHRKGSLVALVALIAVAFCFDAVRAQDDTGGKVIDLNDANFDHVVNDYEIVIVNFYADWCRFSQMLKPIYEQAAALLGDSVNARLARVNCEDAAAQNVKNANRINKYPTLKIFRNGKALRSEYRGQRSAVAIEAYVRKLMQPPVHLAKDLDDVNAKVEEKKHAIVAHFASEETPGYDLYSKIAKELRDNCQFIAWFGSTKAGEDGYKIVYQSHAEESPYEGGLDFDNLLDWVVEHCTPLVREITFENGEELTEEGLPFLILFYDPNDKQPVIDFTRVIKERFAHMRNEINFITGDGTKFSHPLQHLGKTRQDLPVLAADTFRHMHLFKNWKRIFKQGPLEQFLKDLFSGKLHHDLHHPSAQTTPDPYAEEVDVDAERARRSEDKETIKEKLEEAKEVKKQSETAAETVKRHEELSDMKKKVPKRHGAPPDEEDHKPVRVSSVLNRLAPSDNRYSFVRNRDEL